MTTYERPFGRSFEDFQPGDLIVHSVGAAGGYGDVLDRDPQLVLRDLADDDRAVDGCSVPTWAEPIANLARGFASLAPGMVLRLTALTPRRGFGQPARRSLSMLPARAGSAPKSWGFWARARW